MKISTQRIYSDTDRKPNELRILVDRIWPRGLSKQNTDIDLWAKELAPSTELRKWFGHDPDKWPEFKKRYFSELDESTQAVSELVCKTKGKSLLLLFGAKDERHNNAVALREYLESYRTK